MDLLLLSCLYPQTWVGALQHSQAAGPTAYPSTSAELLAKRSERFFTSTCGLRSMITTSYSGGLSYGRASQRLKRDDWETKKWRIKNEKNRELGVLIVSVFPSVLHLSSVLSLVWKKICFYFLAQVVFTAKHDTSASASSQVILCLLH